MHELSIAESIVSAAESQLCEHPGSKILRIEIEIGSLSGVLYEALETAMPIAARDSGLENAEFVFSISPARASCPDCKTEFSPEDFLTPCPKCGAFSPDILSGKELIIRRITYENPSHP
jgi:hydrogenase nickel incorporation protein HypA/HybF